MDPEETSPGPERPPLSRLAVAGLVLAFLFPPAGFVVCGFARRRILRNPRPVRGFGIAVLGMVVGGLLTVFLAGLAVAPTFMGPGFGSNESSATACLNSICGGEEQFKVAAFVDQNGDGTGEYGFLSELGGTRPCRKSGQQFSACPFIPRVLGTVDGLGISYKAGYCFKIYLPGPNIESSRDDGHPLSRFADAATADLQETRFLAYAWPQRVGNGQTRVFVIDEQGQPYAYANRDALPFSGVFRIPAWDEALEDGDGDGRRNWSDRIDEKKWVPVG